MEESVVSADWAVGSCSVAAESGRGRQHTKGPRKAARCVAGKDCRRRAD